jgi:hypothetical protein
LTPGRLPGHRGLASAPDPRRSPCPTAPTPKQLRLLRTLATERGQTFAVPHTKAQASREIARLKAQRPSTRSEATRDRCEVSRDLARAGGAAAPRSHEIVGYGASARWGGRDEVQR